MTFITLTRHVSFSEVCLRQISHARTTCAARFSEWRRRARSRRELRQLGDLDLQDIGWTRAEATAEALQPFWEE